MAFLSLQVDDRAVQKAISEAPQNAIKHINFAVKETAVMAQRFYRQNMPTGVSGFLRRSVEFRMDSKVSATVEPTATYADYVEHGTKPHWTSAKNLQSWANLRGLNVYALQRSIARKGTRPHPFQDKTYAETADYATNCLTEHLNNFIDEVNV